jgi:hypothetical protein
VIETRDEHGRPIIDALLTALVRDIARTVPDLSTIDADRILFVSGAARLAARASIRPLGGPNKPSVVIRGVPMLYEICLRPRFFRDTPAQQRLLAIVHELWHASPGFDGTLADERRHQNADPDWIEAEVARIVDQFARSRSSAGEFLRYTGELRMLAWRVRPASRIPSGSSIRRAYDEGDLFLAIVESRD